MSEMIYFVKICFHQSNNQDLQTELNTGDVFNTSSSSVRGRAGGSTWYRYSEGRGLVPTSPHRGALSVLLPPAPRRVLRHGPPSLRPFSAPVAKSVPPAGFCCMEICTKQLFIVRLPTAGKSYLFIPHNPSTFLPASARPHERPAGPPRRQGCEGWQRSLRSPRKVISSVLCCGQRKKLVSSVVCTTG